MDATNSGNRVDRIDGLRLIALSRIERCANCPRLPQLVAAHRSGGPIRGKLCPIPASCSHEVCGPLVRRMRGRAEDSRPSAA